MPAERTLYHHWPSAVDAVAAKSDAEPSLGRTVTLELIYHVAARTRGAVQEVAAVHLWHLDEGQARRLRADLDRILGDRPLEDDLNLGLEINRLALGE